jgi:hypothetical protein
MCYDEELSVPLGQLLIERGADITEQSPVYFSTPLHVASLTHNCGLATLLLANGADVHGVTTSWRLMEQPSSCTGYMAIRHVARSTNA